MSNLSPAGVGRRPSTQIFTELIAVRTLVDIPKSQIDALDQLASVKKLSRAALVRKAADNLGPIYRHFLALLGQSRARPVEN